MTIQAPPLFSQQTSPTLDSSDSETLAPSPPFDQGKIQKLHFLIQYDPSLVLPALVNLIYSSNALLVVLT
ncbi:hypothetical protein L2E82_36122 [Cichorium intybus]|uniref:Uncharacterized protein n=1 Tax=Cichorium intybus TaxID=13427 RepID=A0ACB9BQR6_CICIN|nr:hypothetical protein L2E82_36122 [Cichorium intybus]